MSSERSSRPASGRGASPVIGAVAMVVALLVVIGGYGAHWRWVGVSGTTATLWDWLHLLLLPLAAVVLPLWLRHRPRVSGVVATALTVGVLAFVSVVLAGYVVPWGWTGFVGNTLWDWLNLGALPLAVALIPVLVELRSESAPPAPAHPRRHAAVLAVVAVAFLVLVLAGYLAHWRWTGFTGNTVWDWLHLLLLPLLVPAVIVPVLRPLLSERFRGQSEDDSM